MAVIYRSIVEVEQAGFVERAPALAAEWLRWKLDQPELELEIGRLVVDEERGVEIRCAAGSDADDAVFRVGLYENRVDEGEQVASTFTALEPVTSRGPGWTSSAGPYVLTHAPGSPTCRVLSNRS
jgi:hypothetical protein